MVTNNASNNVNQRIRDNRKHNETNPFLFTEISRNEDIVFKQFFDIAENNVVLYENGPIFNVIDDAGKDEYPFILNGEIKINGDEISLTNRFYKDVEQLTKASEKMIDKYNESLDVLFTGEMIKYAVVLNKVKRSDFGTGCIFFYKNY